MTSPRQIAANRANARMSTGPRTPSGVARSRLNALRHGAFAELAVVPQLGETLTGWMDFRDAVVRDLGPVGPVEQALARRAAHLLWRLQRVAAIDAASGLIAADLPPDPAVVSSVARSVVRGADRIRPVEGWTRHAAGVPAAGARHGGAGVRRHPDAPDRDTSAARPGPGGPPRADPGGATGGAAAERPVGRAEGGW
jgi:hypothetical protein